jgi:hypothetical protein
MHARAPIGTRVEEPPIVRRHPEGDPREGRGHGRQCRHAGQRLNMTYNNTGTIGSQDGDIQIKRPRTMRRPPTMRELRCQLPERFPGYLFLPAGHHQPILNFGAPWPIDVQVRSSDPTVPSSTPTGCSPASVRCPAWSMRVSSNRAARP